MSFPLVVFTFLVTYLTVTTVLANVFTEFNLNLLLLELDDNTIDLSQVEERRIEQSLNHFDPSEKRTFKMRYFERLDLWQPGGPIIIFLGGEWEMNSTWLATDAILTSQIAKDTNGALFATEHRYYGKSIPNIPQDNVTEFYTFLSSQQALADVAYLIETVKSDPKYKSSKVVVVGGSYPGNLAVWLREHYSQLVDAAVAASAPVLAKKDFKEYLEVVTYAFSKYGGVECFDRIKSNFSRFEELLKSSDGIETLKRELNICPGNDLTMLENQQFLFHMLYNKMKSVVQYSQYASQIKDKCKLKQFKDCLDVDFSSLNFTSPWTYQYCSEFGYLQTTTSEKQPFVHWNPLEFILKSCKDFIKGDKERRIDEVVARTNQMYGGKRPNVTKVVFTHGDMDPWHPLGVLEDLGPDAPATMVNGTSHCAVLSFKEGEPEELTKNRAYVRELIKKWISTS